MARVSRLALLAIGVMVLIIGCQEAPLPVTPPPDLLGKAREAMARGDYDTSARLLRQAVAASPDNLEAHYRLAVSTSYLDFFDETHREFEWVVAHGVPDSAEVKSARDWLRQSRAPTAEGPPSPEPATPRPDRATLSGRVVWAKDGAPEPQRSFQLFMKGIKGTPVEDEFYRVQTDQQGAYGIADVVPGEYSLTNRVAGPPIWRLKVTLKAGENVQLDLTPENSVKVRDDFPDTR
jgi:hypothetical protein